MRNRSVIEIMVLTLLMMVAGAVVFIGLLMLLLVAVDPAADISGLVETMKAILTLILGALLGLLAGKAPSLDELAQRPEAERIE